MKLRIFVDFSPAPDVLEMLQEGTKGHQLVFPQKPVSSVLAKAECDPEFATVHIAFGQPDPQAIAENTQLKWIHVSSSGITRYDNPQFRALMSERGIAVSNSACVYNEACADHALSFMLAQSRNLPLALKTRTGGGSTSWVALRTSCTPLRGQTVLILGYGAIGKRLMELLRPFHMNIIAYRRKPRGDEGVPVIKEDQLAHSLAVEADPEPLPDDHPLLREPNCFITPHVAGGHAEETKTLVRHFLGNFKSFIRGEPLLDRVM